VTSIWLDSFPSLMLLPQQHVGKLLKVLSVSCWPSCGRIPPAACTSGSSEPIGFCFGQPGALVPLSRGADATRPLALMKALPTAEEKGLVLPDRPAERPAEAVLRERGCNGLPISLEGHVRIEKAVRIKSAVPSEFKNRTVQLIGARFRNDRIAGTR
jgi:hypothetical protein